MTYTRPRCRDLEIASARQVNRARRRQWRQRLRRLLPRIELKQWSAGEGLR